MAVAPFLIFRLGESYFAVEATSVLEIVFLPEISRLEETPNYVVGVVHRHGRVVPVVDMNLRFGYSTQGYRMEDCIVFLERQEKTIGLLVNEALVMQDFDREDFVPMSDYGADLGSESLEPDLLFPNLHFLWGVATWEEKTVMILQIETLLDLSQGVTNRYGHLDSVRSSVRSLLSLDSDLEAISVMRQRTIKLAEVAASDEGGASLALAVVRIGAEFFGIELGVIREFAQLRNVTPIPCCPDHVIGQINVRGDLITVTDISKPLGLPPLQRNIEQRVVIMQDTTLAVGVMVDELLGVKSLKVGDLGDVIRTEELSGHDFRRGSASDGTRSLSVIDLPILLRQGSLIVNEKPT